MHSVSITPSHPRRPDARPPYVSTNSDRHSARFTPTALDPATAAAFATQQQWFIAVAGSRGPVSVATVLTVPNVPVAKSPAAS
jgi:NhaP-type Na+/H+ or K+/H+ antiporter